MFDKTAFLNAQNLYDATRTSRHVRKRQGFLRHGSSADYHYEHEADYLLLGEIGNDIDRNDPVVGQGVSRLISNVMQSGFISEPDTGNDAADRLLNEHWLEWSTNPEECDVQRHMNFDEQTKLAFRCSLVAGDIFGSPHETGALELLESYRCRASSRNRSSAMVHGIRLNPDTRERVSYSFTRDDVSPFRRVTLDDLVEIDARDMEGNPNIFHLVVGRKRPTQTRGVTVFAPVIESITQRHDIDFAKLVQAQNVSAWGIIRQKRPNVGRPSKRREAVGPQSSETIDNIQTIHEKISPGLEIQAPEDEEITAFSPDVPNDNYFPHIKHVLTYIANVLDLPFIIFALDPTATNFSGYRGAIDQARMRFREYQSLICNQWHKPIYEWKGRELISRDRALRRLQDSEGVRLLRHKWHFPRWAYIEPGKDAAADILRIEGFLSSHRRVANQNGLDFLTVAMENIADIGEVYRMAMTKRREIVEEFDEHADNLDWRELLRIESPSLTATVAINEGSRNDLSNTS